LLFTARRLEAEGVLMMLAARAGPSPFAAPGLRDLSLAPLDSAEASRLLEERAGHLASALRGRVLAEADGNPLALVELAAAVTVDSAAAGTGPLPVTHSVQELLADQIARLGEPTASLLLLAAAEATGDLTLVLSAAKVLGTGAEALTAAERAGLVAVDQLRLTFRHPLVRAASYHSAPLAARQAAHRALAAALDGQPDPDGRRAWHLAAAASERDEGLAAQLDQVAERSRTRGGYAAVSAAYERAAQLTPGNEARARRLVAAGSAAYNAGQMGRAERLVDQAQQLTSNPLRLAEIALFRTAQVTGDQRARIAKLATAVAAIADRYPERAYIMLCVALGAAPALTDPELSRMNRTLLSQLDSLPLPPDDRLRLMYRAVVQRSRLYAGDQGADIAVIRDCVAEIRENPTEAGAPERISACLLAFWLGDHDALADISAAMVADCRRRGMLGWLPSALQGLTFAQILRGEWAQARASALEGLRLEDMGQSQRTAFLAGTLAVLAAHAGDEDGCGSWLAEYGRLGGAALVRENYQRVLFGLLDLGNGRFSAALERLATLLDTWWKDTDEFIFLPDLVEAAARCGDLDQARRALARFEAWANLAGQPWAFAVAHRCRALVSDAASAETHYLAAVAGRHQDGRPFEHARALLLYGEWLRRQRRRTEARAQLTAAHEIFEDLGAACWIRRTAKELAATGAAPADAPARPAGVLSRLTPQELQVVQLAAAGLSNRDIGAQMFLSPRTVGYHLYKAYPKLGVTSRAELARLVSRLRGRQLGRPFDHPDAQLVGDLAEYVLHGHGVGQWHDLALGVPAGHALGDLGQLVGVADAGERGVDDLRVAPAAVQHDPARVVEPRWHLDPAGRAQDPGLAGGRAAQRGEQQRRASARVAQQHRLLHIDSALVPDAVRDDGLRGTQQHLGERDRVDTQVEQQAVTPLGAVALSGRVHGAARTEVRGHRAHLTDRAVGDQLPQPGHGRAEPGPHRLHGEAAGRACRRDDLPGRRRGDGERLLHQDRLARGERGQGQRAVLRMRGGQVDHVHIRVVEQCPVGAVRRRNPPSAGQRGVRGGERRRPLG
jgi:DNA-binding CsgD family transcriptional regulator